VLAWEGARSSAAAIRGDLPAASWGKTTRTDVLIVREERPRAYLEALAGLFQSLTDARVSIEGECKVVIGDAMLSDFDVPKKWNDGAT